ncbi:uncharacterized protein LOC144427222 [Styela clava]
MKRGKITDSVGICLPDGNSMSQLEESNGYKYLGILESNSINENQMKKLIIHEYTKRLKQILKSKLNGGNIIKAINIRAVSVIRYSAVFIGWSKNNLEKLDRKSRKLLTMYGMLHPRGDVDRLYLPRQMGGRGLMSVEDCVQAEKKSMTEYAKNSEDILMKAVYREGILCGDEDSNAFKERKIDERMERWKEKPLHGKYLRETKNIMVEDSWNWLKKGYLKKETEGLITAAQEQALRTNVIKAKIEKRGVSAKCRMCDARDETVFHILCECSKLAQREYKYRHDNLARIVHWELCKLYGLNRENNWYDHTPEKSQNNDNVTILWDFNIQTDHVITHRRPDIVVINSSKIHA